MSRSFAVWITGLPASGKSVLTAALRAELEARGIRHAVLESDELRKALTPNPTYDEAEREIFYRAMALIGQLLAAHGVNVIFDATANRRRYRDRVRGVIERFLEVHVDCPFEVCVARDPKGIYRRGREVPSGNVPGMHADYEPPERPDVVVRGDRESPESAARRIVAKLQERGFIRE